MVDTLDEVLARLTEYSLLVNNLFQRTDPGAHWQANLRTPSNGGPAICCGWGVGETPVIALEKALNMALVDSRYRSFIDERANAEKTRKTPSIAIKSSLRIIRRGGGGS